MNYMKYLLPICFMLIPFSFLTFGLIHAGHLFGLILASVVVLTIYAKNKFVQAFAIYAVLWQIFIFIATMVFFLPSFSLAPSFNFIMFLMAGLMIYVAVIQSDIKTETFYNFICVSAIIQAGLALPQVWGFDLLMHTLNYFIPAKALLPATMLTGSLGNPNFIAAYWAISLPFFFRKKWCYALLLIVPLMLYSHAKASIIPAFIMSAYYFGGLKWAALSIIPGIAYFSYYWGWQQLFDMNLVDRGTIWVGVIKQIFASKMTFVFGYGNGAGYGKNFPMHNEWLTVFHQFGLIGLSLLFGYVISIYRKNKVLFCAFCIAAINMLGNYPLHLGPSAFLIIMIAGLIERERAS